MSRERSTSLTASDLIRAVAPLDALARRNRGAGFGVEVTPGAA